MQTVPSGGCNGAGPGTRRLMVVDDHEVVRAGLLSALADDPRFSVVGDAGTGCEAVELARRTLPDVAIVDLRLPDMPGDELCGRLRSFLPDIAVIVLSSFLNEEAAGRAIGAGAAAYVTKAEGLAGLRVALDQVSGGSGAGQPRAAVDHRLDPALSPRQQRVIELVARGLTYRGVAQQLGISESTVRFHIQKLKRTLATDTRTELVVEAVRLGLVTGPGDPVMAEGAGPRR